MHPPRPIDARGHEQGVHVTHPEQDVGERMAEKADDNGSAPVRHIQAEKADAGEEGGGAVQNQRGLGLGSDLGVDEGVGDKAIDSLSVLWCPVGCAVHKRIVALPRASLSLLCDGGFGWA